MENFTPENFKKFLMRGPNLPPRPSNLEAQTSRGQHVTDLLHNEASKMEKKNEESLDGVIRQAMGEMVRQYVQAGRLQELKGIMQEHKKFIDEILQLPETPSKK